MGTWSAFQIFQLAMVRRRYFFSKKTHQLLEFDFLELDKLGGSGLHVESSLGSILFALFTGTSLNGSPNARSDFLETLIAAFVTRVPNDGRQRLYVSNARYHAANFDHVSDRGSTDLTNGDCRHVRGRLEEDGAGVILLYVILSFNVAKK